MFKRVKSIILIILFKMLIFYQSYTFAHVEAIIFDCDGVLVDTERLKYEAWKKALNEQGITFTLEEYIPLIGYSSKKILSTIIPKLNDHDIVFKEIIHNKNKIYKNLHAYNINVYVDAVKFLQEVINAKEKYKYKVAIVSSAPKKEIIRNIKHININPNFFDLIASGEDDLEYIQDVEKNKPKPYIYIHTAKFLKVLPKNCIVFEDTQAGVDAAFNAGMKVFAVPNDLTVNQKFSNAIDVISFKRFSLNDFLLTE